MAEVRCPKCAGGPVCRRENPLNAVLLMGIGIAMSLLALILLAIIAFTGLMRQYTTRTELLYIPMLAIALVGAILTTIGDKKNPRKCPVCGTVVKGGRRR